MTDSKDRIMDPNTWKCFNRWDCKVLNDLGGVNVIKQAGTEITMCPETVKKGPTVVGVAGSNDASFEIWEHEPQTCLSAWPYDMDEDTSNQHIVVGTMVAPYVPAHFAGNVYTTPSPAPVVYENGKPLYAKGLVLYRSGPITE